MADVISRILADPTVSTVITAFAAGLIALWLLASMWVHADAEHRTGSESLALIAAAWMLLSTPLMLPLSFAVYALVRPPEPLSERRFREITASMIADSLVADACGECGALVDAAWRRCPTCAGWLAAPCDGCGRWSDVALDACPWCGAMEREQPTASDPVDLPGGPLVDLPGAGGRVMVPASVPAGNGGSGLLGSGVRPRTAERRTGSGGRERVAADAGERASRRSRSRPGRSWLHRRAGGSAAARSLERAAGGQPGARSRP